MVELVALFYGLPHICATTPESHGNGRKSNRMFYGKSGGMFRVVVTQALYRTFYPLSARMLFL